jgi:phosphatidylserine/phosphatidylglycerophosphate/cardiolipin synthase-like enzyme
MKKLAGARAVLAILACSLALGTATHARTKKSELREFAEELVQPGSTKVPAAGDVEFAFSPNEGSEALVLKVIASAHSELRVLAYSFTSAPITKALLDAKKRGVDVKLVVDYKNNVREDRSGKAKAALGALATAGILVRTISVYPIHHDKTIVADHTHVETGSFNYSASAAKANSENVLVLWNNPRVAAGYLAHWERNWRQGADWNPNF